MLRKGIYIAENKVDYHVLISYLRLIQKRFYLSIAGIFALVFYTQAQNRTPADSVPYFNLDECIAYALQHQPGVLQSGIGIEITKKNNAIYLSGWIPQVSLGGDFYHYLILPTAFTTNQANPEGPPLQVKSGIYNTLTPGLSATETLFSPSLLYAAKDAHLLVEQAKQANDSSKINAVATVSSAFYNLLNTLEQIMVLKEGYCRICQKHERRISSIFRRYS